MSGPLRNLKKVKKTPFQLNLDEETKRLNIPFRPTPTIGNRYSEDENKLLDEITQNLASKRLQERSEVLSPFHDSLPKKLPGDVSPSDFLRNEEPKDSDLIGLMASRLQQLETREKFQSKEIIDKDKRIRILEEKLQLYQKSQENSQPSDVQDLRVKCALLQNQVKEMEDFLADYGLMWVGEQEADTGVYLNTDTDVYLNISADPGEMDDEHENKSDGETSETKTDKAIWTEDIADTPKINFDSIISNIEELNQLAGEGVGKVQKTVGGARLKMPEAVPLSFYANGMIMFAGPFRPYSDPETQACLRDLVEGYFPYELKHRYPEGVPFQVTDKRDVYFDDRHLQVFTGAGQVLGGEHGPSRLVPSHLKEKSAIISQHDSGQTINHQKHKKVESTLPGPKLTVDQFLNKLPKSVVKQGKVIDIRSTIADNLQGADNSATPVIVVETEETAALRDRLQLSEADRPPSARNGTTLRIKSAKGNTTYILKMKESDKVGQIRQYLAEYHGGEVQGYEIVSAYPRKVFQDDSATLAECGLVPNATLHLKIT